MESEERGKISWEKFPLFSMILFFFFAETIKKAEKSGEYAD